MIEVRGRADQRENSKRRDICCVGVMSEGEAKIIDGTAIAAAVHHSIKEEVAQLKENYGKIPGLAVVMVGNRKRSQSYLRMKMQACALVGIRAIFVLLAEESTEEDILDIVLDLNANPDVHGILVQESLPKHVTEDRILHAISLEKDVDGVHPINIGNLCLKGREPLAVPCTPKGCLELLLRSGVPISGQRAVVVGRSDTVGMPVAMLLSKHNATVTIVHSCTQDSQSIIKEADIVVAASSQAQMIKGDWIKPGAAVIDVSINVVDDATETAGYRIVGDTDFEQVKKVAGWITPVPGGVVPMSIAMLLQNTLESAKRAMTETS